MWKFSALKNLLIYLPCAVPLGENMSQYKNAFALAISLFILFGLVASTEETNKGEYNEAKLKESQVGSSNPGFEEGECPDSPNGFLYGWHFVLPGNETIFVKIEITYINAGKITSFISFPTEKHAYVYTETPDTIVSGTATVDGSETKFNLSHVCKNEGHTTTTTVVPPPTTTTTTIEPPPTTTTTTIEPPTTTTTIETPTTTTTEVLPPPTTGTLKPAQINSVNTLPVTGTEMRRTITQAIALVLGGATLIATHYIAKNKRRKNK